MFNELFSREGLSLDRLRTFCIVAEAGGITKAAGGQGSRQSQFSRQIKQLEVFFGTELMRRQGNRIVLTTAGSNLARIARESFTALDDLNRSCRKEPLEVSIGAGDALLQWLLFPRVAQLHDEMPNVAFDVQSLRTLDIAERVRDLRLDFGLIRKEAVSPSHRSQILGLLSYSLFVPRRLFPRKTNLDWKKVVASVPLATIAGDGAFRASLEHEAIKAGLVLKCSLSCSSFPQAARALQSGRYAAILPSIASIEVDPEEVADIPVPFLKAQTRKIFLIWNARMAELRPITADLKIRLTKLLILPESS